MYQNTHFYTYYHLILLKFCKKQLYQPGFIVKYPLNHVIELPSLALNKVPQSFNHIHQTEHTTIKCIKYLSLMQLHSHAVKHFSCNSINLIGASRAISKGHWYSLMKTFLHDISTISASLSLQQYIYMASSDTHPYTTVTDSLLTKLLV